MAVNNVNNRVYDASYNNKQFPDSLNKLLGSLRAMRCHYNLKSGDALLHCSVVLRSKNWQCFLRDIFGKQYKRVFMWATIWDAC